MVTYNWASMPDAFHGIAFEGNHEVAQFQVRFFGLLAYTVRFPKIAIKLPPVVYTHRLDTGKHGHTCQMKSVRNQMTAPIMWEIPRYSERQQRPHSRLQCKSQRTTARSPE